MKIVFCPYDHYDLPGREGWLHQLAKDGWFIRSYFSSIFFLSAGEPKDRRFHIEPPHDREDYARQQERNEMFALGGWQELCTFDGGLTVYYTDDPNAEALYSDDDSKAESFKHLEASLHSYSIRKTVIYGLIGALLLYLVTTLKVLPLFIISVPLSFVIYIIWSIVREFKAAGRIRRARKCISQGRTPPSEKHVKPWVEITYMLLSGFVLCALILGYWGPNFKSFVPELPDLREIDGYEVSLSREADKHQMFSVFSPLQYGETQQTTVPTEGGSKGVSYLQTNYYKLTFPFFGRLVARAQLCYAAGLPFSAGTVIEQYELDMVMQVRDEDYTGLACMDEGRLVVYRYRGDADLMDHYDLLTEPVR